LPSLNPAPGFYFHLQPSAKATLPAFPSWNRPSEVPETRGMTASEAPARGPSEPRGAAPSGTASGPRATVPPSPSCPHPPDPRAARREAAAVLGDPRAAGLPSERRACEGPWRLPGLFPSEPFPCKEGGPHTGADKNNTGRGPLLGSDGRDPNIPQRHDLRPLPSTPTTSGQPRTVAVAAPPEAGGWLAPEAGGWPNLGAAAPLRARAVPLPGPRPLLPTPVPQHPVSAETRRRRRRAC